MATGAMQPAAAGVQQARHGARRRPCLLGTGSRATLVCQSTKGQRTQGQETQVLAAQPEKPDAFSTASDQLRRLLMDKASGDVVSEFLYEVSTYTVPMKLTLFSNLGSFLSIAAFAISLIFGEDPLGGIRLTPHSLESAEVGVAFAIPLVAWSLLTRTKVARRAFPVMDSLHDSQARFLEPMIDGMTFVQLLILASIFSLPAMLVLLPAVHGYTITALQVLAEDVLSPMGLDLPPTLQRFSGLLLPAVLSAHLAAWTMMRQLGVKQGEWDAIRTALTRSDAYFRLSVSQEAGTTGSGDTVEDAQEVSEAFKAVAVTYLLLRKKVCQLSYILTALSICYFGIIWHTTNDLSTPLAAALTATLVELMLVRNDMVARKRMSAQALKARSDQADAALAAARMDHAERMQQGQQSRTRDASTDMSSSSSPASNGLSPKHAREEQREGTD